MHTAPRYSLEYVVVYCDCTMCYLSTCVSPHDAKCVMIRHSKVGGTLQRRAVTIRDATGDIRHQHSALTLKQITLPTALVRIMVD
jgi:hypothetical protein